MSRGVGAFKVSYKAAAGPGRQCGAPSPTIAGISTTPPASGTVPAACRIFYRIGKTEKFANPLHGCAAHRNIAFEGIARAR